MKARVLILPSCLLVLLAGCTTRVSITQRGHTTVQNEPTNGAVHPYPGLSPLQPRGGPFVAVFLSTESDLGRLAQEHTHHLYFRLVPCSQQDSGFDLVSGAVFAATDGEREQFLGSPGFSEQRLYKVHIPLDLHKIVESASGQGALDVPVYVETARRDGLCIQVGGGQMWGEALFSNLVRAPLAIRENTLVLVSNEGR